MDIYKNAGDMAKVREYIVSTTKKRGQLRRAIIDVVTYANSWLDSMDKQGQLDLIACLDQVTDGKIFVEVERARLVKRLAAMKEDEGKIGEAADLLQEVQVETFGSMDKIEKSEYILNQMRVMLKKGDFIRVQIASRKVNPKFLEADDFQEIKIRYYDYLVQYWVHENKPLEVTKCYQKMFGTKCVKDDPKRWKPILESWIIYLLLSPYGDEQNKLKDETIAVERKMLEGVVGLRDLLKEFMDKKLIVWPLKIEGDLKKHEIFTNKEEGAKRFEILRKRVVQHNIRICSLYYTRATMKRLMELMKLDQKDLETEVGELVCNKTIYARIDRPAGVITFNKAITSEDRMNKWSSGIDNVLGLVKETCHLIAKEKMIQEARAKMLKKK